MQKPLLLKKWSILLLTPLVGIPLYQNCGSVNLLGANTINSKTDESNSSLSCPAELPSFHCGDWEPWSDAINSCGIRNRSCQRDLPAGCNEETSELQTESLICGTSPTDETYTTQTEHADACGGSYKFESFPDPNGDTRVKTFKLKDNTTHLYILPDTWSSATALVLRYSDGSAKIQMRTPSCELQTIEARFKDKCGASVALGYIYTMDGCPPPNPNIETGAEDVVLPHDANGALSRAQSIEIGFDPSYYSKPQFRATRNVESLVAATYGLYGETSNPAVIARDWYAKNQYWFRIPNGKYISMRFTAPNTTERLIFNIGVWEQPVEGGGPLSVSISEFPGDFYIGRADKGCMIGNLGYGTVQGFINLKNRPDLQSRCHLNPGQKYYINVTGAPIPWVGEYTGGNQHTTWFTQLNMYYSDPPYGRIYDP